MGNVSALVDSQPRDPSTWRSVIEKYRQSSTPRAVWQLINTLGPYAALWYLMFLSLTVSWWLTLPLAVLAGVLLVRIFIIFHDCGHGSYFGSPRANDIVGFLLGVVTFTPYHHWRWEHAIHHASAGHLGKRGTGDIWTMTVQEYLESSRWRRFAYQLARNPIVLFVLAPLFLLLVMHRYPSPKAPAREHHSVWWTNFAVVCLMFVLCRIFGVFHYAMIQLTISGIGGAIGIWLFYVQHQFEDVYWERGEDWDYAAAALHGSSFYQLPRVLQWLSGNIGFHHIHHLSARIPNYNLQRCHESEPLFRQVRGLTLARSLKAVTLRLWDEDSRRLVGFAHARRLARRSL